MKKIVGIIAALALAGSVFARPDITPVISEFTGNAKLEWIANLDAETTGMKNSTWARWKIQMRTDDWGGESNASADGMWGELVMRAGGGYTAESAKATGNDAYGWTLPDLSITTAKVHFIDGDTYLNVDILAPDFGVGYIEGQLAIDHFNGAGGDKLAFAAAPNAAGYQGFTVNFGVPIVDVAFAFGDNGEKVADAKQWAFKLAATLKPVDGLKFNVGFALDTANTDGYAVGVSAAYKYAFDDKFYVSPFMNFTMKGKKMDMGAAVLFGWGTEKQQWNHDFLALKNSELVVAGNGDGVADGISVAFAKGLSDAAGNTIDTSSMAIAFYDGALLAGLSDALSGLKLAARYEVSNTTELGKGCFDFGLIYRGTFDIVYVNADFVFGINLAKTEKNTAAKYVLQVGTKEVIANTDLYLKYAGSASEYVGATGTAEENFTKGSVTLGCQINF